jgi:hypothetical protein
MSVADIGDQVGSSPGPSGVTELANRRPGVVKTSMVSSAGTLAVFSGVKVFLSLSRVGAPVESVEDWLELSGEPGGRRLPLFGGDVDPERVAVGAVVVVVVFDGAIDIASRRIVWRHGTPGSQGADSNHLSNPDDAIVLPNGAILTADIKNCRLLLFDPGASQPRHVYGTTGACLHHPPTTYGSPNGAFPMDNGHYLVTEINGDWVDEIDLAGTVYASVHPPGVAYPSDTNEVSPGTYLTVDYSDPGQIETFDSSGRLLWRYQPTGAGTLNHPSLAVPLANGAVLATDDHNDRIIVVDPKTNQIVWQYGQRGLPGSTPGLLNGPDGLDLTPPNSDLVVHARTMGVLAVATG